MIFGKDARDRECIAGQIVGIEGEDGGDRCNESGAVLWPVFSKTVA